MDGDPTMPVRGLTTEEDVDHKASQGLQAARLALGKAAEAIQDADDALALVVRQVTLDPVVDRHGAERIGIIAAPILHAADLVRQARRTHVDDHLNAQDAISHALDVIRGWVV